MGRAIPTTIVSGFPAIGKSYLAKKFPTMARDLESSDFHWIKDENGEKVANPKWPNNYIETIQILDKSKMYRVVLTSSHELIRTKMTEAGIKYTNICPVDTESMKQFILARCKDRGSPEAFIADLERNYSKYVQGMINDPGALNCVQVDEKSIFQWDGWALME